MYYLQNLELSSPAAALVMEVTPHLQVVNLFPHKTIWEILCEDTHTKTGSKYRNVIEAIASEYPLMNITVEASVYNPQIFL